jgi:hypothetical protein
MKRSSLLWSAVLAATAVWLFTRSAAPPGGLNEIEYQGQRFKVTKIYANYEDYKEDPDNIDATENARIENAVASAKVASSYPDKQTLVQAVFSIKFPGYGLTSFGEKRQPDGTTLLGFAVEIPHAAKSRIVVYRGDGETFKLVDDFVTQSEKRIMGVHEEGVKLVYCTLDGKPLLFRPMALK